MCGIVGMLNLTKNPAIEAANLQTMLGTIRHRGPDQFGTYIFQDEYDGVGLGSARLSIIDLTTGQQPVSNEDGTIWIVFNGEIFNYLELRPDLEKRGHVLATNSDTEVLIHLYEEYGPGFLNYLNGQFALAIWDEKARTLFMARDRLGIRPVYYTIQKGSLLFASEIKALLTDPRVPARLDPVTVDQIFTFWSPLSPRTSFESIYTLPPGHFLLARRDGDVYIERYWSLSFPESDPCSEHAPPSWTLEESAHQLRELLVDATQLRLRADVPVGAYLSGGLDSSAIAALIRRYTGNRLETFSIAFEDAAFDESAFQRQMSEHLGAHHHLVTCTYEDIGRVFPDVIWHTEVPIMRTSPAPLYLLSKLVQDQRFKVVLTGEGADEFLAGYNIFKEAKIRRFWARQPDSTLRPLLLRKLYPYIGGLGQGNEAYLRAFFGRGLTAVEAPDYSHVIRWHNNSRSKRIYSPAFRAALEGQARAESGALLFPNGYSGWTPLAKAQYLEISIFLSEYLLSSQSDRVAMAHSVEGRFPFLDYRVVEFCNQLPSHYKLRGLDEKHILKQAVRDLLPDNIWHRPKRPYRAPIHRSFFPDGLPLDWVRELLSQTQLESAGFFEPQAVNQLLNKVAQRRALSETDDMTIAGLISTQLVYHHFVADFRPPSPLRASDDIKAVDHSAMPIPA